MSDINPDIDELFPDLKDILRSWDRPADAAGPVAALPDGVTMEDVNNLPPPNAPFASTPPGRPPVGGVEDSSSLPAADAGFSTQPTEPANEPPVANEPPAPAAPAADAPSAAPAPSQLSDTELEQLIALRDELRGDPHLRERIARYYVEREFPNGDQAPAAQSPAPDVPAGTAAPGQVPQPVAPAAVPSFDESQLDLEDPSVRALYDQHRATLDRLSRVESFVQSQAQQTQATAQAQATALYNRAAESFRQQHNLEAADIKRLSEVAANLQLVPALMSGRDPMTNLPARPDPIAAVERALEIAFYTVPEYRERALVAQRERDAAHRQRKQRLGSVAGSSGSVPRTPPPPANTPEARRQAMVNDVAAMMNGSYADSSN